MEPSPTRKSGRLRLALAAIAGMVLAGHVSAEPAAAASTAPSALEGEWMLVRQFYGNGTSNLADLERSVRILVRPGAGAGAGAEPDVRITAGLGAPSFRWPAFVADDGPAPLEVAERVVDPTRGLLSTRYTVRPAPGDVLRLECDETYRLEGGALVGDLEVRFFRDGVAYGSYVLHRRFERVAP